MLPFLVWPANTLPNRHDAGVESMSMNSMGGSGPPPGIDLKFVSEDRDAAAVLIPMGITSENVAAKFGVSREHQDAFSVESHARAHRAQEEGLFEEEILAIRVRKEGALVRYCREAFILGRLCGLCCPLVFFVDNHLWRKGGYRLRKFSLGDSQNLCTFWSAYQQILIF